MKTFDEQLEEDFKELANNPFKKGDIVKIKKEFLELNEKHSFHVVKDIGIGYASLTEIIPENEKQPSFAPIIRTKINCIESDIYGNCLKDDNEK